VTSKTGLRALARRYAKGLAEAAPRELGQALSALDGWKESLDQSPRLKDILMDPRVAKSARADLARELMKHLGAPAALINLIGLVIEDNRFFLIDPLHDAFLKEREKREGIQCVVIESSVHLPDALRERIRSRLAEILRLHVRIEEQVRPHILGGINLRMGSRVWYGSAVARLEQVFR